MPVPLASLAATTLATFAARRSLGSRRLEAVAADEGAASERPVVCPAAGEHVAGGDGGGRATS